jgi:hypothetical protein
LPPGLIKDIDIDVRITNGFSYEKNLAIADVTTADNGKIQMEFSDHHWDMTQIINGREIHQRY